MGFFFANSVKEHCTRTYQGLFSLFTDMYMYIGLLQITSGTFFKLCLFCGLASQSIAMDMSKRPSFQDLASLDKAKTTSTWTCFCFELAAILKATERENCT